MMGNSNNISDRSTNQAAARDPSPGQQVHTTMEETGVSSLSNIAVSQHQQTYRGALTLNNYAVTMMQQGHFQGAMLTVKDALSFMSECITMEVGGGATVSPSPTSDDDEVSPLNKALRLAMSRLVFSQKNPSSHDANICPFDEGDLASMIAALQRVPKGAFPSD
jgi:hypothetical protein